MILKELKNFSKGTSSEIDIKDYILENPEKIERLSARELGQVTYTSSASVVRFCRKLGFAGYADFKLKFISELKFSNDRVDKEKLKVLEKENIVTMMRKVREVQRRAIDETTEKINFDTLKRVAEMIHKAEVIDFYTYDTNRYLAEYGCSQYLHANKRAVSYTATNMQSLNALASDKKHFAIFISHTGENGKLVEILKILKFKGVKTFVITADIESTMARLGDEVLIAAASNTLNEFLFSMFFSSAKYLLDILWGFEFAFEYEKNMELNKAYEKIGEDFLWGLLRKNKMYFTKNYDSEKNSK